MRFDKNIFDGLLERYGLTGHVEGGMFKEIFRSARIVTVDKKRYQETPNYSEGTRSEYTTIYFALPPGDFSAFHRVKSDERWNYCYGSSATIHMINPETGELTSKTIGMPPEGTSIINVPRDTWFAVEPTVGGGIIATCDVAPGFEYQDFELADRAMLVNAYPKHSALINRLTRVVAPTAQASSAVADTAPQG